MVRFGLFCPPAIGHLNPTATLGLELQRRGHQVFFLGVPDALAKVDHLGFTQVEIGAADYPPGYLDEIYRTLGRLTGRPGLQYTIALVKAEAEMLFREAPTAIESAGIEVLILDQITAAMATVADHLKRPFITVCNALPVNREPGVPPYFTAWAYDSSPWAQGRNQIGNGLIQWLTRDLIRTLGVQRQAWNLPAYRQQGDAYSPLAQISQLPRALDFPRRRLPAHFHYLGPFQDPSGIEPITTTAPPFPFDQLDDRPLIYASLGTLQNQRPEIFVDIAEACRGLEAQLVISLGNPRAEPLTLPGNPLVVPFAPHQRLIERSQLVITHAGMNTVLTALSCAKPLVTIPITNEQPGIAARVERSGTGRRLGLKQLSPSSLGRMIREVLEQPSYRARAQALQEDIARAGGVRRAAEIAEQVARTHQPVVA